MTLPDPALIEIVERSQMERVPGAANIIVPNEVRINGIPLLVPADQHITVHDIEIPGGMEAVMVTLTLFARRVVIGAELGDVPGHASVEDTE